MLRRFFVPVLVFLLSCPLFSSAQFRIVVMGSSTAAGTGASQTDSSWVGRLRHYYNQSLADGQDTLVQNIAWYGQTSYHQMPTGWVSPVANRPAIDAEHNITKALSLRPDLVIISLPSNDVANLYWDGQYPLYTVQETMNNFRHMAHTLHEAGVAAWFTSAQPRDDVSDFKRGLLRTLNDSILRGFPRHSVNSYNVLAAADGSGRMRPELKADEVHPNNAGHRLLFETVRAARLQVFVLKTSGRMEAEHYAAMQGVQTESTSDAGGGQNLGYIDPGDYMDYYTDVPVSGTYTLNLRVASGSTGGRLSIRNQRGETIGSAEVPATGSWQTWTTVAATLPLPAGRQTLRLLDVSGNWNFNWMELRSGSAVAPTTTVSARVEAENYLSMSGVQTEATSDEGGGRNVGYIDQGDWMDYALSLKENGWQTLNLRLATPMSGGAVTLFAGGRELAVLTVPATGGWQTWQTVPVKVDLPAGEHRIRLQSSASAHWNINWLEAAGPATSAPSTASRIEAEHFSAMSGIQLEGTSDAGGGQNVGYIDPGDWMDYKISPPTSGTYTLSLRLATPQSGGKLEVRGPSGSLLASVFVPNTGGWQSWTTVQLSLYLNAGPQTLRLQDVAGNWNINWLELSARQAQVSATAVTEEATADGIGVFSLTDGSRFLLRLPAGPEAQVLVQVTDLNGAVQRQFTVRKGTGAQQAYFPLSGLAAGEYIVLVRYDKITVGKPVVKLP